MEEGGRKMNERRAMIGFFICSSLKARSKVNEGSCS